MPTTLLMTTDDGRPFVSRDGIQKIDRRPSLHYIVPTATYPLVNRFHHTPKIAPLLTTHAQFFTHRSRPYALATNDRNCTSQLLLTNPNATIGILISTTATFHIEQYDSLEFRRLIRIFSTTLPRHQLIPNRHSLLFCPTHTSLRLPVLEPY